MAKADRIVKTLDDAIKAYGGRRRFARAFLVLLASYSRSRPQALFFDGLRLTFLRPVYRGRRAGVVSFRLLRLAMDWAVPFRSGLLVGALGISRGLFFFGFRAPPSLTRKLWVAPSVESDQ
jgi:hypothetical protein